MARRGIDLQPAAAELGETAAHVVDADVASAVVARLLRVKARTVVRHLHDPLVLLGAGAHRDAAAVLVLAHTVAHRVLHDRLQRQRGDAEVRHRDVILHPQHVAKAHLLQRQIVARVVQLLREGDRRRRLERVHVAAQKLRKMHDRVLGLGRVAVDQLADRAQGVEEEVRLDLAEHDRLAHLGIHALLADILLGVVIEHIDEHRHRAEDRQQDRDMQLVKEVLRHHADQRQDQIHGKGIAEADAQLFQVYIIYYRVQGQHHDAQRRGDPIGVRVAAIDVVRAKAVVKPRKLRNDQHHALKDKIAAQIEAQTVHAPLVVQRVEQIQREQQHQQIAAEEFQKHRDAEGDHPDALRPAADHQTDNVRQDVGAQDQQNDAEETDRLLVHPPHDVQHHAAQQTQHQAAERGGDIEYRGYFSHCLVSPFPSLCGGIARRGEECDYVNNLNYYTPIPADASILFSPFYLEKSTKKPPDNMSGDFYTFYKSRQQPQLPPQPQEQPPEASGEQPQLPPQPPLQPPPSEVGSWPVTSRSAAVSASPQ